MKKFLLLVLLVFFLASCANTTTQLKKQDLYPSISVENIKKYCDSTEQWQMVILGLPSYVLRFDNCLKVKTLLAISIDTTLYTEKIRQHSIDLLALHYVEYLKRKYFEETAADSPTRTWFIKRIKEEIGDNWNTYFYDITYKIINCSDSTCTKED